MTSSALDLFRKPTETPQMPTLSHATLELARRQQKALKELARGSRPVLRKMQTDDGGEDTPARGNSSIHTRFVSSGDLGARCWTPRRKKWMLEHMQSSTSLVDSRRKMSTLVSIQCQAAVLSR